MIASSLSVMSPLSVMMMLSRGMIITNDCQLPLCDEPPVQHLLPVHLNQVLSHLAHQAALYLLVHLHQRSMIHYDQHL